MFNQPTRKRAFASVSLIMLLGVFCPAAFSLAQAPPKPQPASSAGGPKEGIKVHGEWTIDIRNPDGTLVSHHEFKNALQTSGAVLLGHFLQRTNKAGEWVVSVTGGPSPCNTPCWIYEPATQFPVSEGVIIFKTLTISSQGGANNNTVFAGTATASQAGVIDTVYASNYRCSVDSQGVCPANPFNSSLSGFTRTTLATPINVVAGQIIQVTVVISFS